MDVWEQPEGGEWSGSGYLNFLTLCERLLSCIPLDCKITVNQHTFIFHGITSDQPVMKPNKTHGHDYSSSKVICTMIYNHPRMGQVAYRRVRNIQGVFGVIIRQCKRVKSEE
jgi:hypothetical protein